MKVKQQLKRRKDSTATEDSSRGSKPGNAPVQAYRATGFPVATVDSKTAFTSMVSLLLI